MENNDREMEVKKPMTTEERLTLATKLDKELDEFIAGLERRSYNEGWPEDRWEEEMEKHPFFMTKPPEDGKLPPLLEGIQQLKYDETANTPTELANSYKEDGNFNFKCKKYRMAVLSYTEGIRQKCGVSQVEAHLYSNRAAAQFHLANYRSSLTDCLKSLKCVSDHTKAKVKAAQCYVKLEQFDDAIAMCDDILADRPTEPNALKSRSEAVALKKIKERDTRKGKVECVKLRSKLEELLTVIQQRNVNVKVKGDLLTSLEESTEKPRLINGQLTWPVFFLYPEFAMSDFIEAFHENDLFISHLEEVFETPPPWDQIAEYKPAALSIYYQGKNPSILYEVDSQSSLSSILSNGRFIIVDWKPSFYIFVRSSPAENNFLQKYHVGK